MRCLGVILFSDFLFGVVEFPYIGPCNICMLLDELREYFLEQLELILMILDHIFELIDLILKGLLYFFILLNFELVDFGSLLEDVKTCLSGFLGFHQILHLSAIMRITQQPLC